MHMHVSNLWGCIMEEEGRYLGLEALMVIQKDTRRIGERARAKQRPGYMAGSTMCKAETVIAVTQDCLSHS